MRPSFPDARLLCVPVRSHPAKDFPELDRAERSRAGYPVGRDGIHDEPDRRLDGRDGTTSPSMNRSCVSRMGSKICFGDAGRSMDVGSIFFIRHTFSCERME